LVLGLLRNKIRTTKKNPASSGYFKTLGDLIFQIFQNQKTVGSGLLKEKKIRIKYLPVLGISKPQRPANFHKTTRKELADFLGGQFFACFKVLENQGCM
jgi:hypothetical protein